MRIKGVFSTPGGEKGRGREVPKEDMLSSMAARALQRERNSGSLSLGLSSGT